MKKVAVLISILTLSLSLLCYGCGGAKKTSSQTSSKTTPVDTGTSNQLQVTNVQLFPSPYSSTKDMDVIFKVTNPYRDFYSKNTYVQVNLYDTQGKIAGTSNGCIWSVYPGSRWCCFSWVKCVGDPTRVEAKPSAQNWLKIPPENIPKTTITQATPSGSQVVGSVYFETHSLLTPSQIAITGVVLDANGNVVNYGIGQVQNPKVGDNPFNLSFYQGNIAGQPEYSFELI